MVKLARVRRPPALIPLIPSIPMTVLLDARIEWAMDNMKYTLDDDIHHLVILALCAKDAEDPSERGETLDQLIRDAGELQKKLRTHETASTIPSLIGRSARAADAKPSSEHQPSMVSA